MSTNNSGEPPLARQYIDNPAILDTYQEWAFSSIGWDDATKRSIRGQRPIDYLTAGILEETLEVIGPDLIEPSYDRVRAIISNNLANEDLPQDDAAHASATDRHAKEFGDVSWYLANTLTLLRYPFSKLIIVGELERALDIESNPRGGGTEGRDFIEQELPGFFLIGALSSLRVATESLRAHPFKDGRLQAEKDFIIAGGKFVVASAQFGVSRFSRTYVDFLEQNRTKLTQRAQKGTIFDGKGGTDSDDR